VGTGIVVGQVPNDEDESLMAILNLPLVLLQPKGEK
jgi:hypothetical protein